MERRTSAKTSERGAVDRRDMTGGAHPFEVPAPPVMLEPDEKMKRNHQDRVSWAFAIALALTIGVYVALNWNAVFRPLAKIIGGFFR